MTPERWNRINALFLDALDWPAEVRDASLVAASGGDAELLAEVRALLKAHHGRGTLFVQPSSDPPPRPAGPEALVGSVLDERYFIEALVGRGGMGAVYRANHLLLRDTVAIKMLADELGGSLAALARFRREGEAMRRFRHPNAVAVHELHMPSTGPAYLVLEFVNGSNLREVLRRRGPLPAGEVVAIVEAVASVLDAAHAAGVVHRDLKPENIMLGTDGVKVLDLGIAKLIDVAGRPAVTDELTRDNAHIGTPSYMSPEQWGERSRDGLGGIDGRTDVYSLGVVAYELVAGTNPFAGASAGETIRRHLELTPPRLDDIVDGIGAPFAEAVDRAFAKDRADRHQTASAFARSLRTALDDEPRMAAITAGQVSKTSVRGASTPPAGVDTGELVHRAVNLPAHATSLVGRGRDVAEVRASVSANRLVTLTGPGGVGKTRLAIEVASGLRFDVADGVWMVELASIADPNLVSDSVARALGVADGAGADPADRIVSRFGPLDALVLLDNCEHVAAPVADLVNRIVRDCPRVRVLATSREALRIAGEFAWRVPSLDTPAPGRSSAGAAAVRLFVDRARNANPSFVPTTEDVAAVSEICRHLDGIPLAIELAAARVRSMTPQQILDRIGERFELLSGSRAAAPRHRTLRAALDWSHDLLDDGAQRLLRSLSVFGGGFSLEAVAALEGDAGDGSKARTPSLALVDRMTRLVDSSLVVAESGRFRMLETVRVYAAEKLAASDASWATWSRFTEWATRRAVDGEDRFESTGNGAVLVQLEAEHENMRAALGWLLGEGASPERALRLCAALGRYWQLRGYWSEGRGWATRALAATGHDAEWRSTVLRWAGSLAALQSDCETAIAQLRESVALARTAGDGSEVGRTLQKLGLVLADAGHVSEAAVHAEEALGICRDAGDALGMAMAANSLGVISQKSGDSDASRKWCEVAAAGYREAGNRRGLRLALHNLGTHAMAAGENAEATRLFEESLEMAGEVGDLHTAYTHHALGEIARMEGDHDRAAMLLGASLSASRDLGERRHMAVTLISLGQLANDRGDVVAAVAWLEEALGLARSLGDSVIESQAAEAMALAGSADQ